MKGFLTPVGPWSATAMALALASMLPALCHATTTTESGNLVKGTGSRGKTKLLENDRYPALYTGKFGDCLGGNSQVEITGFDAAYYADNMTVMFHLTGSTEIKHDNIMAYISVDAYGEDRFDMIFNPCSANIYSLCPMNASTPIAAEAIIPVTKDSVSGIPPVALVIPDFEGYATLRLYSNTTKTEIGCYQAVMTNGASLSHPKAVGSVLAIFTAFALMASAATAIYGISIPVMRTHYAHSLSVLVIFELFQSFFFSGALSLPWPSVCVAWWSNFAWSAGMINSPGMTRSISNFVGTSKGNLSHVGGGAVASLSSSAVSQIYGKTTGGIPTNRPSRTMTGQVLRNAIGAREYAGVNTSQGPGYSWYGGISGAGLPLPGLWSNFAGELSEVGIPAPNAFMTGFIWFLIALVVVIGLIIGLKLILEALGAVKLIRRDRLDFFRGHWLGYLQAAVLRTMMAAFFMMMTLTFYQFSISGPTGVTAIAVIVFAIFFVGLIGIAAYCCFHRLRFGRYEAGVDHIIVSRKKVWKFIRWPGLSWHSKTTDSDETAATHIDFPPILVSFPIFFIRYVDADPLRLSVHEDQAFIKRYGWLSARFRRTRWWFFTSWFTYQFIRAGFVGGASRNPETQVIGLLVVEIIWVIFLIALNPFEGSRNTALAVYLLSLSKVATAGLSIAFLPRYNLARIPTTVVGVFIVIIQGVVAVATLILIVLGMISSYMSLTRNCEDFKPRWLEGIRYKYFMHLQKKALDIPPPPQPKEDEKPAEPIEPYFKVNSVHREPKIEDEEADILAVMTDPRSQPIVSARRGRANSAFSTSSVPNGLPFGARAHRQSWSSQDFTLWQQEMLVGGVTKGGHSRHNSVNKHRNSSGTMEPLIQSPQLLGHSNPIMTSSRQQSGGASQWPFKAGESSQSSSGSSAENLQQVTIKE